LFKPQFDFLQVQEQDTIVDLGAASGWYEGVFSAYSSLSQLTFILVDLNEKCLSVSKVDSMKRYYESVKKAPITNKFVLVKNTPDSLYLLPASFKKVWLMNTFHELEDRNALLRQIKEVLLPGGEIVVLDVVAQKPGQLHGGCHKPLATQEEIRQAFEQNGFSFRNDMVVRSRNGLPEVIMTRFIRM
ncbi:MAG TPA: methyltransferase domain-containing protein, partial [Flavisolibacter sp.]|nr:methyltransferase domain-containing protein [Flavisolibacter sp.]